MTSRIFLNPDWSDRFQKAGWDSFEKIRSLAGNQIASGGKSGVLEIAPAPETGIPTLILKRYRYPFVHMLRTWLVSPKAGKEYRNLLRARAAGLLAPEPLAYGFHKILGFEKESILLTEKVPNTRSLREVREKIVRGKEALPPFPRLHVMLADFSARLRRFHDDGQFHHSLFFKNVLWAHHKGEDRLYVIDNPWGNRLTGRIFHRMAVVRDLACLEKGAKQILPRTARLRFLKGYLKKPRLAEEDRALAIRVSHRVAKLENDTPLSRAADNFKHYFHGERYWRTVLKLQSVLALLPLTASFVLHKGALTDSFFAWTGAILLALAGMHFRAWGLRRLLSGRKRFARMADEGAYSRLRQPVYLGNMLLLSGASLAFGVDWVLVGIVPWVVLVYWGSNKYEERFLLRWYGSRFREYRKRVPLFLPKLARA